MSSWWNTSNFTDLASKALKNAQKQIDKALDIQESEAKAAEQKKAKASAEASSSSSSKTESGDFWSSWLGDTIASSETDDPSKSPRNAWSLPWGAGAGSEAPAESSSERIQEKTAEEIKSEVLKAAKERTKAKSKLFPQKSPRDQEPAKETTRQKDVVSKEKEEELSKLTEIPLNTDVREQLDNLTEIPLDTDDQEQLDKLALQTETTKQEKGDRLLETLNDNMLDNLASPSKSVKLDEVKPEVSLPEVKLKDTKPDDKTNKSVSETLKESVSLKQELIKHSTEQTIKEKVEHSEGELGISHQDLLEEMKDSQPVIEQADTNEINDDCDLPRTESDNVKVVSETESKVNEDIHKDEVNESFTVSKLSQISSEATESVPSVDRNPEAQDKADFMAESSGADISSSVEFVTVKDIETAEIVSAITTESGDAVNSDPEIIDVCDKTESDNDEVNNGHNEQTGLVGESSQSAGQSEVEVVEEIIHSESYADIGEIPVEEFSVTDVSDSAQTQTLEAAGLDDSASEALSPFKLDNLDNVEKISHLVSSDSESSMSKLDTSVDTCTSEETLVELSVNPDSATKDSNNVINTDIQEGLNVEIDDNHHKEELIGELASNDLLKISQSEKSDESKVLEAQDESTDNSTEDKGELSPANSFVKCMLEDAIDDSKQDDNSDSHSATEKSDGSRSVYSNHESSDEIDTTTSSDIEIISMPTPNGENRQVSPVDPIPLRIALQKTSWPSPTHRRTDSSDSSNTSKDGGYAELSPGRDTHEFVESSTSSRLHAEASEDRRTDSTDSSNTSKDGGYAELSPGRDTHEFVERSTSNRLHAEPSEGHRHDPELPALSEEDDPLHPQKLLNPLPDSHRHGPELPALSEEDDPLHPQKLLKEGEADSHDMESHDQSHDMESHDIESHDIESHDTMSHDQHTEPDQKLAEVSEVLQAREEKLLMLSKENCDLTETNNILRNQLKQAEEAREAEMTDINELTTEFTQRLTDAEKRISSILKEKEILKKQLQDSQTELAKRAGDISLKEILAEKEEQIAGLLEEGEKLSKSQLQSNNIIKKLRQKEKDNESTLTTQKKKLDTQKEELDHLHKVLESKEEVEKKQTEAITQLSSAVKKQEAELTKLKSDNEEATEKMRGLQAALDNSYKEMAELHRNNAAQDSKVQEIALSAEMQVREELKLQIEKQQQQNKWEKETLGMQIEDLQMTMTRMEKDHSRREDLLRQEIADLQKQLQEDEARTQELTQGVSLATRPLLRQIENLQATFNAQSATWEKVEKNLSDRLSETQNQLAVVTEKERNANEQLLEISTKVSSLEAQNSRLRQEKSQMTAQLEMLKSKVEISEDAKQHEVAQLEVMKQQMQQEISDIRKEKVLLETQLDVEKSKMEQEKKKSGLLQEQIRDLERDLQRSRSRGTPVRTTPSPVSVSRQDSLVGSLHEQSFQSITQEELDRSFILSSPNGNKQSLYEALRQSGAANLLENLQSQLKLRDGEINHLQGEIRSLERTRESMAKELVDLSNKNDDLEDKIKDLPLLISQHQELDQRYNALLQMYGEKVEEANELRMDLADVKEMYKAQITQLLGQS